VTMVAMDGLARSRMHQAENRCRIKADM